MRKAIESFVDYEWDLSNMDARKIIKKKSKFKKPYSIRIFSIIENNLKELSAVLKQEYDVESKMYKDQNGYGSTYYYLSIHKKNEVGKLIMNDLLSKQIKQKLYKAMKKT